MKTVHYFGVYSCVLVSVFLGCIKEDLEICLPQPVQVSFTFIPSEACAEVPIIPTNINRLTVFLFDEYGRFVQQLDTIPVGADYQMELSLVPAHYQMVTIAGYDGQQLPNAPFIPGITNIKDAAVTSYLEQQDGLLGSAEQVLYMGADTLTVMPEVSGQGRTMTLIQQTKILHITVDGIANSQYQIALAGNAAQYTFGMEQVYLTGSPPIFIPLRDDNGLYKGTTLVNWPLKNDGDNTKLQIINPATGARLINEDLLELILRVPNIDLECSTGFDIEIEYRVGRGLAIYIENWKVYDDGYILI